ncbi:hypothetical protein [Mucilaginibacter aquariorum]|uniref:Fibronectin type-III domain-containing protein n=1 Tax=Mucilaginibacter aquariorum TaxID=2967225 RepID=A0ABT1SXV1_9SPHI|nr:hypothetical protein [Mucilaginibacter aquariorum]MCQ6957181.1 hypothetical protein [Mucilaginibacter aquariorum]
MEKIKRLLILSLFLMPAGACKKDKPHDPIPVTPEFPRPALLSLPEDGQPCFLGTSVSDTQSKVSFSWNMAANTDSYELHIKNLLTGDSTRQSTTMPTASVSLLKNTPYSWYVVSRSGKVTVTAASKVWKFYNSGPGISVYPPYPAQLLAPANGAQFDTPANNLVRVEWTSAAGSSPIKEMMIYTGTDAGTGYMAGTIGAGNVFTLAVSPKTLVYWKVVTKDLLGNTSTSQVYSFYAR